MTKQDLLQGKPFTVSNWGYDVVYTEHLYGGEIRISNGRHTQTIQVERITEEFFIAECWLNAHVHGKIYFKDCELK